MTKGILLVLSRCLIFQFIAFLIVIETQLGDAVSVPLPGVTQDEMKRIETKLSRERQKFEAFNSKERDLLTQLSSLQEEVREKRQDIETMKKRMGLTMLEIKSLQGRLAQLDLSMRNVQERLAKRLVAFYKYARRGYMKMLADVRDVGHFWRRVKYVEAIVKEDRKIMMGLAEEEKKYKKEVSEIREQLKIKKSIKDEEEAKLSVLGNDLDEKVIRLMKIHKEKEFYETAVKELQLAAQNLGQSLMDIEGSNSYESKSSSGFGHAKGRLPVPIQGTMIRGDSLLGRANRNLHKSIFIECTSHSKVRAVFPGRVDFSGPLKGYGKVVVINHGSRFFTISALLSEKKKEKGDLVKAGDVIGLVSGNGSANGGMLYFEIRRGGRNLDPLEWLKGR